MENQYSYYEQNYSDTDSNMQKKSPRRKIKAPKVLKIIGSALLFGVVASFAFLTVVTVGGNLLGLDFTGDSKATEQVSQNTVTSLTTSSGTVTSDVSKIVENAMPSVVSITSMSIQQVQSFFGQYGTQEVQSSGSGIIIAQNDTELLIVTNNHVVEDSETLTVTFNDNTSVEANVKGTDATNDIAVIAVALDGISDDTKDAISIATLGDSTKLKVGEPAIAIGNALGYGQSVTTGIISAVDRQIMSSDGSGESVKLIQTDAAINPGNSGGALLNANGQVIGINSSKIASNTVEGMGYAIPISDVSEIITELMNQETKTKVSDEEKGYLGIQGLDVTEEATKRFNMPTGVYVSEALEGTGAEAAGIAKGNIITALNGTKIDCMETLQKELQYYRAGETVKVTLQVPTESGEYKEKTVEVTLSKQP